VEAHGEEKSVDYLKRCIDQLPGANRDTLAYMILHLKRVADKSSVNKMPITSLAKIFGPSLIGTSAMDSIIHCISENEKQIRTIHSLLTLPTDYWEDMLYKCDIYKSKLLVLIIMLNERN